MYPISPVCFRRLHYAAVTGDKGLVQKILDLDSVMLHGPAKEEVKAKPQMQKWPGGVALAGDHHLSSAVSINKGLGIGQKGKAPAPKLGLASRQEKALELNTSFERDYVGSPECQEAEAVYVNYKDYEGRTPLHAAALKGNYEAVKILVYNKASVFIRDRKKQVQHDTQQRSSDHTTWRRTHR